MGRYRIRVATGAWLFSGSHNRVQLWLVGACGEAELQLELRPARGQVSGPDRGPPTSVRPGLAAGGRRGRGRPGDEGHSASAPPGICGGGERIRSQGPAWPPALLPSDLVLAASTASLSDPRASVSAGSAVRPGAAQRVRARGQLRDGPRSVTSCPALPRPPQAPRLRCPEQGTEVSGGLGQRRLRKGAPNSN